MTSLAFSSFISLHSPRIYRNERKPINMQMKFFTRWSTEVWKKIKIAELEVRQGMFYIYIYIYDVFNNINAFKLCRVFAVFSLTVA